MGYDLHITRAKYWFESDETPIPLDEWRQYVEDDPELKVDPINNHRDDELMVLWFGEGGVPDDSEGVGWFWWNDGQIDTKNPDLPSIRKMTQIAAVFQARVLGDDSEEYRANGEIWNEKYIDKAPNLFQHLSSWWAGTPLPERKTDWVMTGKWD